jgi:hypothetical protein
MANEGVSFDPSTLYNFLAAQNNLPLWVQGRPDTSASGYYDSSINALVAPAPTDRYYWRSTLAHEMAHASLDRMRETADVIQANAKEGKAPTSVERRFLDAYRKIYSAPPQTMGQYRGDVEEPATAMRSRTINALAGDRFDIEGSKYKSYRTSPKEALAFGVGGMTEREPSEPIALHLDPTMATEFSILRALHDQLPKNVQEQSALNWDRSIKDARAKKELPPEATPSNTFYTYPDPFLSKK